MQVQCEMVMMTREIRQWFFEARDACAVDLEWCEICFNPSGFDLPLLEEHIMSTESYLLFVLANFYQTSTVTEKRYACADLEKIK